VTFYRQFHALVTAGMALPLAFEQLVRFAPHPAMAQALARVAGDVRAGSTLGEALGRHGAQLDDANIELIAFAEEAGKLEAVVAAIIAHLEKVQSLRWRALMMMIWPGYLGAAVVFVGPLLEVAQGLKPGMSIGALYLSSLGRTLGWAVVAVGGFFVAPLLVAVAGLEVQWDRLVRSLPLVSRPVRDLYASRFVMTLGLGTAAGMETHRTLRAAVKATYSPSLFVDVSKAEAALRAGETLTDAVERLELLDRSSLGSLAVAESTGTLDETLAVLSRQLEEAALRAMRLLMIAVVALIVVVLLVKIVVSILGAALGPMKRLYDAAGSGNLDSL
jgi:type IV pilus assembly protein PilC